MDDQTYENPTPPRGMSVWVPMLWFAIFITLGALVLKLPICAPAGQTVSWMESVFTSIAAVTCTGLMLRDPATGFSTTGQCVLAGLMAGGAMVMLITGARAFSHDSGRGIAGWGRGCLMRILKITLMVLACLGIVVFGSFLFLVTTPAQTYGSLWEGLKIGIFGAISALSNTGWSLTNLAADNAPVRNKIGVLHILQLHMVILPIVAIGSLGWPVWRDVLRRLRYSNLGVSQRTRQAIIWTLGLYLAGTCLITLGQMMPYSYSWLKLGIEGRNAPPPLTIERSSQIFSDASFTTVAARSTGFSLLSIDSLQPATRFVMLVLMFIGGVPGSCAGGIGVTSCAVMFPAAWAALCGRSRTPFEDATYPAQLRLAWSMLLTLATLIIAATFFLTLTEPFSLEKLLFEAVSASCNAGQSLGITGSLTSAGKCTLMTCMILGRVLPMSLWIRFRSV